MVAGIPEEYSASSFFREFDFNLLVPFPNILNMQHYYYYYYYY